MGSMTKKRCVILSAILIVILVGMGTGFYCLRLMFGEDVEFRYGNLAYWLNTDGVIRGFPIIGAERGDVLYRSTPQDGPAPGITILTYQSRKRKEEVLADYEKSLATTGLKRLSADEVLAAELGYTGKGYGEIYIEVEPEQKSGSLVKISFINELKTMD